MINSPPYELLVDDDKFQIRKYEQHVIAKTSVESDDLFIDDNQMIERLLAYIKGENERKVLIQRISPILKINNGTHTTTIFFILGTDEQEVLPEPTRDEVELDTLKLNKIVSLQFGKWISERNVEQQDEKLQEYIKDNSLNVLSNIYIAEYDISLVLGPFRKNEIWYQIK